MEEITAISSSTVLNTGTPDAARFYACQICGVHANRLHRPVVLDPVGVGASSWRLTQVQRLLDTFAPDLVRVNLSEARALLGQETRERGVDSAERAGTRQARDCAMELAHRLGCVVLLSSDTDVVTNGSSCTEIPGGSSRVTAVTGSGCMLTAMLGAFCGADPDQPFEAACAAIAAMGVAGDLAEERRLKNGTGNATFRTDLIDAVFNLTEEQLNGGVRYEVYEG